MNDIESMIRGLAEKGISLEDIANQIGETLNTIKSERTAKTDREIAYNSLRDRFNKNYEEKSLDVSDAAALCVLVCAPANPNWTANDLKNFFSTMERSIPMSAELVGKNPVSALSKLLGDLRDEIVSSAEENKSKEDKNNSGTDRPNETKSTCDKPSCTCKTPWLYPRKIVPEEAIAHFLESL